MCGICGILQRDPAQPVDEPRLRRMTEVLRHRGPDGEGVHIDGPLGLGHRRLAYVPGEVNLWPNLTGGEAIDLLGRAIRAMELTGADMIAAYRHDRTMEGLKRGVYTLVYNWVIGILFGWPHRDINFSFKLMKKWKYRQAAS